MNYSNIYSSLIGKRLRIVMMLMAAFVFFVNHASAGVKTEETIKTNAADRIYICSELDKLTVRSLSHFIERRFPNRARPQILDLETAPVINDGYSVFYIVGLKELTNKISHCLSKIPADQKVLEKSILEAIPILGTKPDLKGVPYSEYYGPIASIDIIEYGENWLMRARFFNTQSKHKAKIAVLDLLGISIDYCEENKCKEFY